MTPLLRQFLEEGRDLVRDATRDLLALEQGEGGAEAAHAVFRAFHTLKGSSGLFEVAPMTRLLHAAEEGLVPLRDGRRAADAALVDGLLACLDLVGLWLDALERDGALPADAQARADAAIAGLAGGAGKAGDRPPAPVEGDGERLLEPFTAADRAAAREALAQAGAGEGLLAIRYQPRRDCFFNGDDPLRLFRDLPGLVALHVEPTGPWPAPEALDPYDCALSFHALAVGQAAALRAAFRLVPDEVAVTPVPPEALAPPALTGDDSGVREVLEEQAALLSVAAGSQAGLAGRIGAAATAAANALFHDGRVAEARHLAGLGAEAMARGEAAPLLAAIRDLLAGKVQVVPAEAAARAATPRLAGRGIRVEEARVDRLVALAGEMVVAKNGLAWLLREAEGGPPGQDWRRDLQALHGTLDRLAREMQDAALGLRLVPLGRVFQALPRLVRDLSAQLGKPARLELDGEAVEADKAVVEALLEPLLHLVRNGLVHGVEPAAGRLAAGKPGVATLSVRGVQDRGRVVVEVTDDGRGIDLAAVRDRAVARGLLTAEEAGELGDEGAARLVFAPGLSTAEGVSELSGRGVGMDAVRAAVEAVGGSVSLSTTPGGGTSVRLSLPQSVAAARLMLVATGGRRFGVPLEMVRETARLDRSAIRRVKGQPVVSLRGQVVPLFRLDQLLGLPSEPSEGGEVRLLLAEVDGSLAALEVNAVEGRLDAVLRPLDGILSGLRGYLGTTLLGNGEVLLVLDLREVLR